MSSPTVSIVIPTWNRLPLLRHAVDSVLAQTFGDWELLVVDDGSSDGTAEWLRAPPDPRIRLLSVAHGGNIARVRNLGARAATGRLVAFLDSDDLWLPGKLAAQLDAMSRTGVRWSYTRYEHVDAEGRALPSGAGAATAPSQRTALTILEGDVAIDISTLVVDRRLFDELGGFDEDPRLNLREDYELELRLALAADVVAIPDVLARVRDHAGRATRGCTDPFIRNVRVYDKLLRGLPRGDLRRIVRRRRAHDLAEAGAQYLSGGAGRDAARCLVRSLRGGVSGREWVSALTRGLRGLHVHRRRMVDAS